MTAHLSPDCIRERITAVKASLPPQVRLIAVTKKKTSSAIRAAYECGLRDFGESRLQEAIAKQAELQDLSDTTWHLIGHLQTNKARKALAHFDWIHSLDSLKLARKLNELAAELSRTPRCCLQVKIVPDPPKFGFDLEALWQALPELNHMHHLKIVGLMTIPPLESSIADSERIFKQAHDLADQINRQKLDHLCITELSMGMSGDYLAAISAGSTMIRLGTTLFGDRTA
ncbi:MAG: YggS family pyridoxal phosphate-dependent enzyme [Leptolyngbya sp. SIO1D8]|nr:YggS family pyridoxal phosphate-dependent enzyme [Leptolyngbya sp. SIO1D8]